MYLPTPIDFGFVSLLACGGLLAIGAALELLTFTDTAPDTASFAAMAAATGNSNTIRNTELSRAIRLVSMWADFQGKSGAASVRVRSPKLHDNVQGLRFDVVASELEPLWPMGLSERLWSQDELTIECTGSDTAADIETLCMLLYYEELPGIVARLISPDELMRRMTHFSVVENTLALGTGGGYSGEEAINAEFDQFKANKDYALVGYQVDVECAAVPVARLR